MSDTNRPKRRAAKVDYTERLPAEPERAPERAPEKPEKAPEKEPKKRPRERSATKESSADEDEFPLNWQPQQITQQQRFSQLLDLGGAVVVDGVQLVLSTGLTLSKEDSVYLVCEPPGEPYYVGRIMGFVHRELGAEQCQGRHPAEGFVFKINWWYRSRDISKHSPDSRLLYASMHSDTCPLQSFRGHCLVRHRDEIADLDAYKATPNQFWFDKLFDRYMIKFYDVIPTALMEHLAPNYKKALHKRFHYVFVEAGRSKEMLERPRNCAKCNQWCTNTDSITCCECSGVYHMLCLDPPLLKKPARGFAWSCITCTKKLENKKMAVEFARLAHEEAGATAAAGVATATTTASTTTDGTTTDGTTTTSTTTQPDTHTLSPPVSIPSYEELAIQFLERDKKLSFQQRRNLEEWNYRYLGMHAKLEDALDPQDRPYPRAVSRLGPKNQFSEMVDWYGRRVHYYDYTELSEEYQTPSMFKKPKGRKRKNPPSAADGEEFVIKTLELPQEYKDTDPQEFPPWLQPRPKGYIERGGDDTATLMYKQPETPEKADHIDQYIEDCAPIAQQLGLLPNTPNFVDAILKNLMDTDFNFQKALSLSKTLTRKSLKEPTFTPQEIKKFENGVRKYGSELLPVQKEVKTQPFAMVVRFYYLWKKTPNGHLIWDNFEGRKKNMKVQKSDEEADIANPADDSSYDIKKPNKRHLVCKHCKTEDTPQWFRGQGPHRSDDDPNTLLALCFRCARLWRRYAVHWEDPVEVMKKVNIKGGANWKKRLEQELIDDAELILNTKKAALNGEIKVTFKKKQRVVKQASVEPESSPSVTPTPQKEKPETTLQAEATATPSKDSKRKKSLTATDSGEVSVSTVISDSTAPHLTLQIIKKFYQFTSHKNPRTKFKAFTAQNLLNGESREPVEPQRQGTHCGVCRERCSRDAALLCYDCGLLVHPECYGLQMSTTKDKIWYCDPCSNLLHPLIARDYSCVLCHEKEEHRVRPALKRTNAGQWVHVLCMLLAKDVKCLDSTIMQPIVGVEEHLVNKSLKPESQQLECLECHREASIRDLLFTEMFQLGFQWVVEDGKKPKNGKLAPAVLCVDHDESDKFIGMHQEVKRGRSTTLSSLQVFLEENKKSAATLSGTQQRFRDLHDAYSILQGHGPVTGKLKVAKIEETSCDECQKMHTLKWIRTEDKTLCYGCWLKPTQKKIETENELLQKDETEKEDVEMTDADQEGNSMDYLNLSHVVKQPLINDSSLGIKGLDDWVERVPLPTKEELIALEASSSTVDEVDESTERQEDPSTDVETTPQLKQTATFEPELEPQTQAASLPPMATFSTNNDVLPQVNNVPAMGGFVNPAAPQLKSSLSHLLRERSPQQTTHTIQGVILPPLRTIPLVSLVPVPMDHVMPEDHQTVRSQDDDDDDEDKKASANKMSIGSILG